MREKPGDGCWWRLEMVLAVVATAMRVIVVAAVVMA